MKKLIYFDKKGKIVTNKKDADTFVYRVTDENGKLVKESFGIVG
jgi:hypothetical protein